MIDDQVKAKHTAYRDAANQAMERDREAAKAELAARVSGLLMPDQCKGFDVRQAKEKQCAPSGKSSRG
ncbi:hypothetical protein IIE18_10635 [Pseudomonas sp. V1]|uniref:hypothetical protein n=1 Tax=Pseudomonas arcuscaelestis TaxID=2710591 RepID=UPI00193F9A6A|nr:hypothetical protein [Pseudomonas arcuscaelestis]MBM3105596.1 hypothetical protein [Pseudomonas arcuscaelestis]